LVLQHCIGENLVKVLLIGPVKPLVGGAAVVFDRLINSLEENPNVDLIVVSTYPGYKVNKVVYYFRRLLDFLFLLVKIFYKGYKVDIISFHASSGSSAYVGPFIYLLSRILSKPLIARYFGGAFDLTYERLTSPHRWFVRNTYLKAEISLFQTQMLVNYFDKLPLCHARWFSNYTWSPPSAFDLGIKPQCNKLIFLGRISKMKGIDILLQVAKQLPDNLAIELYGLLQDGYTEEYINRMGRGIIIYKGVLDREEVQQRLRDYDALVLPTFWNGEGYPGAIIEAYAYGLPVITCNWRAIPEIVDNTSGILIPTQNIDALAEAICRLHTDTSLFHKLQVGAIEKALLFDSKKWKDMFADMCLELL
jgi:glycosyltransferase involved in cell wall biosynthesis